MPAHAAQTAKALRTWEKLAPSYDKKITAAENGILRGGREWLGARAAGRVLEVAIGTGRDLPFYPPDVRVTGIDLSPAMLDAAEKRAADLGRDVDLHTGDAEHLPFSDASFDTVVCAISLCTIPEPLAAIREMKRVLVPGGRLLLLDHVRSTWPLLFAGQWLVEQVTIRTAGEHLTRRQLPLVEDAGFDIVEVERLKAGIVERIHARKPIADCGGSPPDTEKALADQGFRLVTPAGFEPALPP
jgi:ubiquinone/menaquinone biosynthesis C-methylase UbiE